MPLTEFSAEYLEKKIKDLSEAGKTLADFIDTAWRSMPEMGITEETTLSDLELRVPIGGEISDAIGVMAKYEIDGATRVLEFAKVLKEVIENETLVLNHLRESPPAQ